jgi:trimeric autotransporter adhesin
MGWEQFAVSGSNVYAGGSFTNAGGVAANNVAKWDGNSWNALGSGVAADGGGVFALAVSGSNVYAGGVFSSAGGTDAYNIVRWDGGSWRAMGSGVSAGYYQGEVSALLVAGSNIYAGG